MIRKVEVRATKYPLLGNLVFFGKEILGGKRKKIPGPQKIAA